MTNPLAFPFSFTPEAGVAPPVFGIDVSHFDGKVDWQQVADSGVAFAYAKATDGASFVDSTFAANWENMGHAGVLRGAYHFFRPSRDADEQADHFLNTVDALDPQDLPPVLDLEPTPKHDEWGDFPLAGKIDFVMRWLTRVEQALGRKPVVYTSRSFWKSSFGNTAAFIAHPLWVAHYKVAQPVIPSVWPAYTLWQYSEEGSVPGIAVSVDLNRFNGSAADLDAFVQNSRITLVSDAASATGDNS